MSLRKDIEKLTKLSKADNIEAKFLPLNGLGRAEQDLQMNNRPVRLRNGINRSHFEETLEPMKFEDVDYNEHYSDEIRKSLRTVLGGEHSNEDLEEHMRKRQIEAAKRLKRPPLTHSQSSAESTSSSSTVSTASSSSASASVSYKTLENEPEEKIFVAKDIFPDNLQNNRLKRNVLFKSLLSKNIISMADLEINDRVNNGCEEYAISKENSETDYRPGVDLVQHPDDPDLFTHPLEAYGKLQYTQDFILDRIGTKKTMTPRQYYMNKNIEHQNTRVH
ncbi:uncharacterized protein LOC117181379 isoform X2 [Belonocnema kinseyi]|uniref:uncharacterized protein LOC117181379 isoform X2 n=1 Tax=Belonocnema kinseyi TaxID=2817044 RepID=UPI00143D8973|nr:uncharacterized protein LOC117181379 isoform X2 [Belonocnema kinseyi]